MANAPLLVISSGGLRSLVAAGVAARDSRIALLHISDGRVTAKQASAAFDRQVAHFNPIKSWIVDGGYLRQMSMPPESAGVIHSTSSDPSASLVPLRDLQLLTVAAGFARHIRASGIVWGAQIEPKQNDALAKSIEFVQIMNQAVELLSHDDPPAIRSPLMGLEDTQVVELGHQMSLPFSASWSCQTPMEHPCMSCSACARRIRAFRGAQLADPLALHKAAVH